MGIDILQRVDFAAVRGAPPMLVDDIRYKQRIDLHEFGIFPQTKLVVIAFVTRSMRYNKFGFAAQPMDQFYGMLDPLALHLKPVAHRRYSRRAGPAGWRSP